MTKNDIAKHVFARHPQLKEVHITSDGQAFIAKHQARGHATRLKDQSIETIDKTANVEQIKVAGFAGKKKVETPAVPAKVETPAGDVDPAKVETPAAELDPAKVETPAGDVDPAKVETPAGDVDPSKEAEEAAASLKLVGNLKTVSAKIAAVATVEELDLLKSLEAGDLNRKGIAQAIEDRRAQLTK